MIRTLLTLLALITLGSCGSGDPGYVRLGDYEGDAGEAMVRHLIQTLPDPAPGVPKEYCVVTARNLRPASTEFTDRMRDMKLVFMNADSLETHRETGLPVNSKSGLSPYVLQLAHMHKPAPDTWDIEAGWAYKRLFERRNYRLKQTGTTWTFEDKGKVDGNYSPTDPAKP